MMKIDEINNSDSNLINKSGKSSKIGKILIALTGGFAVGLTIISAPFISPALRKYCLPFIPATEKQIENILKALRNRSGNILDLGSGDGRIVFECARNNFISHGIELNPWLVVYSKIGALYQGLSNKCRFYHGDLWKFDVSKYDNIVIFGVDQMMEDLERKFCLECKKDCRVIACRFPLPNLSPIQTIGCGIDTVWIYKFSVP